MSAIAVVGTGSIGTRHLRVLTQSGGLCPIAVPIRAERRGELAAQGFSTAADVREAAELGATAAIIATDTGRHLRDGLDALDQGLNLLVEKPLACDAAQARELAARAQAAERRLFTGCVMRFSESLGWFRERLPSLGRLHAVRIECQSYLPDWHPGGRPCRERYSAHMDEGGVLRDLIHEVDYAGWLYGWPRAVQARVRNLGRLGISAEEIAEVSWETAEGCLICLCVDYLTTPPRRAMRACGEHGTLSWDGVAGTVTLAANGTEAITRRSSQTRDAMFTAQAQAFLAACGGAHDPRLATGQEGVMALAVCDAARIASHSRREERVEYAS
ncbi:MAG: Gfo/Idh/MocA family oxidoreductase [Candidatus Omnitrophica bacterium]|nr:Gfo/Idh/MocA family oxidoreductase [Candidatus Omnitrophota bacterium]